MKRKSAPWFNVVGGLVSVVVLGGIIFGNILAFGKQEAKNESVAEKVKTLEEEDKTQDAKITEVDKNFALIQQTLGAMAETLKDIKAQRR